jgi:uncharacterized membrane protein
MLKIISFLAAIFSGINVMAAIIYFTAPKNSISLNIDVVMAFLGILGMLCFIFSAMINKGEN